MKNSISFVAYDTPCKVEIIDDENVDTRALFFGARELAFSVQNCLSMYDEASELSTLCRTYAPGVPVAISPMLANFLCETLQISGLSEGALDPTVGPLVRLWDFLAQPPKVPAQSDIMQQLNRVGYQHLQVDEIAGTLTIAKPGMVIDPGASGKGYALGLVVDYLAQNGVRSALVDFGGNLYVMGPKRAGDALRPWRVAIRQPQNPAQVLGWVEMENVAIATSSWYEHSFTLDGQLYHHLLNPKTGYPMPLDLQSVSIISNRPIYTDLLSTAFFVLGMEKGKQLVQQLRRCSKKRIEYVVVAQTGEVCVSEGLSFHSAT